MLKGIIPFRRSRGHNSSRGLYLTPTSLLPTSGGIKKEELEENKLFQYKDPKSTEKINLQVERSSINS